MLNAELIAFKIENQYLKQENEQSLRAYKAEVEGKLSEIKKDYERKFEERSKSEQEYRKEIEKMKQEISILKDPPYKDNNAFSDSAILTN